MKFSQYVAPVGFLIAFSQAIPAPRSSAPHEERSALHSSQWRRRSRVDGDSILPIRIGLTQNELDKGYEYLMEVSHPSSPNFGKHWTPEEVHSKFAPSQEAVDAVRAWLVESGISNNEIVHSENKGWLAMDIPASTAEQLLSTEYFEHEHDSHESIRVGCDIYHLPKHVAQHIDYITPGVKLSAPLKKRTVVKRSGKMERRSIRAPISHTSPSSSPDVAPARNLSHLPENLRDCQNNITPDCIKALYDIPAPRNTPDKLNSMGLYESGDTYAQSDLDMFFALYAPNVPQGTHPIPAFIDGAVAPVAADDPNNTGESDIDMDMAYSLIYPQTVTLYQTDDRVQSTEELDGQLEGFLNTFLDALDGSYCTYSAYGITGDSPGIDAEYPDPQPGGYQGALQCGVYTPTRVISISYGEAESDLPQNYQQRQCNEFMKLGLQGVSIFVASGDYGVASYPGDGSASGCLGAQETIFNPQYPGNCPYITSVGGTRLYPDQEVRDAESALQADLGGTATLFASSGGFANYFPTADYQQSAVANYFATNDPGYPYYTSTGSNIGANGGIYNRAGRGYPDVSANGAEYRAFTGGVDYHYYGTSLAAPLVASIMTLINEERTYYGKGPAGFVNPVFYENPAAFHDIVNGSNPGCGSAGFHAVSGWDPITGLGTPDFRALRDIYLALP